jgi:hypothetical protein
MDSQGRIFVADRGNSRVQIFDSNGKFVAEWKQFGRPSDVSIDKNDVIYVSRPKESASTMPAMSMAVGPVRWRYGAGPRADLYNADFFHPPPSGRVISYKVPPPR